MDHQLAMGDDKVKQA